MELYELNLEEYIHKFEFERPSISLDLSSLLPLNTKSLMLILRDVSRGLTFIHENKEIHRDMKPGNSNSFYIAGLTHSLIFCET